MKTLLYHNAALIALGHGCRKKGAGEAWPPWIFINGTDKVEGRLMVLFFGFVFSVAPPPWKFFCRPLALGI